MPDAVDARSPNTPFSPASTIPVEEVARRLEAFERTRDPADLWPGLLEADRVAAAREIERVTSEVLAGTRGVRLDPLARHTPYALGVAGNTTGMGPLIGRWIETRVVLANDDVSEVFAEHLISGRSRAARLEREVLPAIDNLIARGISPALLKGVHTARAYFDEPGMRPMSDVDLLVAPDEVDAAEGALRDAGFRPTTAALRPYKRDWIGPGVDERIFSVERYDARTKWTLELHASLDRLYHPGATARLDAERAFVPFDVAGRPLRALSPAMLVVYLACHCSQELDTIRLVRVFELVNVIRIERAAGRLDWADVISLMRRTRSSEFTYPAFKLAEDLAPGTIDPATLGAAQMASTPAARHTVARLVPAGGSSDERAVLRQLMWTRGALGVFQRLLRTIWPAGFDKPGDVIPGWRVRLRRLRNGMLSFRAPDERAR